MRGGGRHSQTNRHNAHLTSRREQSSNVWLGGYLADFPTVLFMFREPLVYLFINIDLLNPFGK